jgi:hypothetical protein
VRPAVVVAAVALCAAGCGHAKPAQSVEDVAPFDTVAIASGSSDDVYGVLHLIPAGDAVAARMQQARGFIGGEFVALLDESGARSVSLAPPSTDQKGLERSLRHDGLPYARVEGWTVWSRDKALVDRVRQAKKHLVDAGWYHAAEGNLTFVSRRLTLIARPGIAEQTVPRRHDRVHELASLIPKDALAAAVFDSVPRLSFAKQIEHGLGVRVADLAALAPHGGVAFLRGGQPVPSVTVLAPGGTLAAARRVVTELDPGAPPAVPATLDGEPMSLVHFGALDLYYGLFDGTLVLTDDAELRLHDVDALEPDGLPDKTSGWLYLAPEQGLPALESLATLAGTHLSDRWADHVFPYRTILAYWAAGKLTVRAH